MPQETDNSAIRLSIEGMTCASCAARIQRRLEKFPEVSSAVINHSLGTGVITVSNDHPDADELAAAVSRLGYPASIAEDLMPADDDGEASKWFYRFLFSLLLSIPLLLIMLLHTGHATGWLHLSHVSFERLSMISFLLATPVQFIAGWQFHRGAIISIRHGSANMNTLVSIGSSAAWSVSTFNLFFGSSSDIYFDTSAIIITLMLLGRLLESRAVKRSTSAISALIARRPATASLMIDGEIDTVPLEQVRKGDLLLVRAGDSFPVDATVVEGATDVDESMLTGEPMPIHKSEGDTVMGGTINSTAPVTVSAVGRGDESALARVVQLLENAQATRPAIQRLADRISAIFVPVVICIALLTLALWWIFTGDRESALLSSIAVLVIACPCAMGLATPTAIMVGTGVGARKGVFIRSAEVLETAGDVDTIIMDKTGTLTDGFFAVASFDAYPEDARNRLMQLAAKVEEISSHPLAIAIVKYVEACDITPLTDQVVDVREVAGQGLTATVNGQRVTVGRPSFVSDNTVQFVDVDDSRGTSVAIWAENVGHGVFHLEDSVRPEARSVVQTIKAMGISTCIASGDSSSVVEDVSRDVGADRFIAGMKPDEKLAEIRRLQAEGRVVAMIGDGINDAPALAQADLGIAVATGTDVAIESAGITLMRGGIENTALSIGLARKTLSTIRWNMVWAFGYNIIGIPLAALGLLNPVYAAAFMAGSSLLVVGNSLRLEQWGRRDSNPRPTA